MNHTLELDSPLDSFKLKFEAMENEGKVFLHKADSNWLLLIDALEQQVRYSYTMWRFVLWEAIWYP